MDVPFFVAAPDDRGTRRYCGRCRRTHWMLLQLGLSCVQRCVAPGVVSLRALRSLSNSKRFRHSKYYFSFLKAHCQSIPAANMALSRSLFGPVLTQPSVSFSSGPLKTGWGPVLVIASSCAGKLDATMLSARPGSDSAASSTRSPYRRHQLLARKKAAFWIDRIMP